MYINVELITHDAFDFLTDCFSLTMRTYLNNHARLAPSFKYAAVKSPRFPSRTPAFNGNYFIFLLA